MSLTLVKQMNELLVTANTDWPSGAWSNIDAHAAILEKRLARAVGSQEVLFVVSAVDSSQGAADFRAAVYTADFVFIGSLLAKNERVSPREIRGDVHVVRRSAIRSLTLHHVDYYGHNDEPQDEALSFSVEYEGLAPFLVDAVATPLKLQVARDLFAALQMDLLKK